jgi:uncharacterized protein (TIGR03083 family)
MEHEEYCARAGAEITRMAEVTEGAALDMPVRSCPDWDLARLIKHTGIVHRWATATVATKATEPVAVSALDAGLPADVAGYPRWLAAGAAPLLAALREAGPDAPVWSWAADDGGSGWWARRMLHETTVHRVDAELALGIEPSLDPVAAADGVDEFLEIARRGSRPSQRLAELPADQTIHLHATDDGLGPDGEWLISLGGDAGYTWSHGHAKGAVAVRGPAALLLLLAYGRVKPDDERLASFGDASLLASWQDVMTLLFPGGLRRPFDPPKGGAPLSPPFLGEPAQNAGPQGRPLARLGSTPPPGPPPTGLGDSSKTKAAGAGVAVGQQACQGGDGDLGRGAGADVEADGPVHAGDLLRWHPEGGQGLDVRPGMMGIAHDADPAGLAGEGVAQRHAELIPVVVGHHDVGGVVQVVRDRRQHLESRHPGPGGAGLVRLDEQPAKTGVGRVSQQEPGDRGGEHGDQRPVTRRGPGTCRGKVSRFGAHRGRAMRDRAAVARIVVLVCVLVSHAVSVSLGMARGNRSVCPVLTRLGLP